MSQSVLKIFCPRNRNSDELLKGVMMMVLPSTEPPSHASPHLNVPALKIEILIKVKKCANDVSLLPYAKFLHLKQYSYVNAGEVIPFFLKVRTALSHIKSCCPVHKVPVLELGAIFTEGKRIRKNRYGRKER